MLELKVLGARFWKNFFCVILPPSKKRCNYGIRASQTDSSLTKFIANSINIYVSK
jgi:hypothetical protein